MVLIPGGHLASNWVWLAYILGQFCYIFQQQWYGRREWEDKAFPLDVQVRVRLAHIFGEWECNEW